MSSRWAAASGRIFREKKGDRGGVGAGVVSLERLREVGQGGVGIWLKEANRKGREITVPGIKAQGQGRGAGRGEGQPLRI